MIIKFTLNGELLFTYDTTADIDFPDELIKEAYEEEQRRIILNWINEHYENIIKECYDERNKWKMLLADGYKRPGRA